MGRLRHEDVRERTINALMQRHAVDLTMADIMARRAHMLYSATRDGWQLRKTDRELLKWAAHSHEIGMTISHKHYHRHSAYLLRNADLPGFSQEEQEQLALLAAAQRGKLEDALWTSVSSGERPRLLRLVTIIRLALVFKYVEQLETLPDFVIQAKSHSLRLAFPAGWLDQHPLTARELQLEKAVLARQGLTLKIR
ncbi:acetate and sugar kinases/Hsc70/actin family protein [Kineobactrum salinum]|uniref:hypothetical protein n=1 Tax=Kineobactrum salinum TaxID=2708301 RepID=UPI001E4470C7|nr:hypothetical protein [Kineobactrum salinum]